MLQFISRASVLLLLCCYAIAVTPSQSTTPPAPKSPAEGYNVHVSAPHVMEGHVGGPYHHYCKVMQPDPVQIVCLIYDTTDANATLTQVEYIEAKSLTRNKVSREDWNKLWHDHTQEIATGRVQVHDLPPDQAKKVADLVSTTDGIIFGFELGPNNIPTGRMMRGQSVGHVPLSAADYRASQTPGAKPAGNK
jgi:hypothetical protein